MHFLKRAKKHKNTSAVMISLPKEIVDAYDINHDDLLEIDIIKNHRDRIKG